MSVSYTHLDVYKRQVHYPSDIAMGRIVGDILLGKLQNDAHFVTLFNNARTEIGKKSK